MSHHALKRWARTERLPCRYPPTTTTTHTHHLPTSRRLQTHVGARPGADDAEELPSPQTPLSPSQQVLFLAMRLLQKGEAHAEQVRLAPPEVVRWVEALGGWGCRRGPAAPPTLIAHHAHVDAHAPHHPCPPIRKQLHCSAEVCRIQVLNRSNGSNTTHGGWVGAAKRRLP